jgi:translocation and assembly module TamB
MTRRAMTWKGIIGWTAGGLLALLLIAALAGYFYLKSENFQQYALRKIVEQANLSTGGRTEIGRLDFNLSTLTAHLYNITLHGKEKSDQPPLLHAEELTVRVEILSALRRKVALRELLLEHPVVHVQVSREGDSNLPAPPSKEGENHTSVFDLAVQHAQLSRGEIYYNDKKIPLDADLEDLSTDIHFAPLARRYDGTLSYRNGRLRYAGYTPLSHNLDLAFSATKERLNLGSVNLKVGSSSALLQAQISNYADPVADGTYRIRIHTQDFGSMAAPASPQGDISLSGKLHYHSVPSQSSLRSVSIDGVIGSEALVAVASGIRVELRKLEGSYQLAGGNLRVNDLRAESLGGRIQAAVQINHLDTTLDSRVRASLSNISLNAIQTTLRTQNLSGARLSGTINGRIEASWQGNANNLRARSDLTLQALAGTRSTPSGEELPVNGAIHATYDGQHQILELRDTVLRTSAASLTANGTISDHSSLQVQVVASDLHQLAAVATSLLPNAGGMPSVSGTATIAASMRGSVKNPAIDAQLSAEKLQIEGTEWSSAKLVMQANPSRLTLQSGSLVSAQRGTAHFSGSVDLQDWSYQPSSALNASLDVQQMRIADLLRLTKQQYPISGDLSAKASLHGSQDNPIGSGSLQIANARAYGEPIQTLSAKFQAENGTVHSTLTAVAPSGAVDANLSYNPKGKAYKVHLDAPALVLQKLQTVQERNLGLTGTVSATVDGEGTVDNPELVATLQLPLLQVRQNSIGDLRAEVRVAQHFADLTVDSKISQASVHAQGHVALSGNMEANATVDTGTIPLEVVLATYASGAPEGFQGQAELHATLKGPLKDKSKIQAHLSIPVLKASYQSLQIGIIEPIRADYADSSVTLQPADIRGTGTSLHVQGRLPLGGNETLTLSAKGSVDVHILKIIAPDLEGSGTVDLDLRTAGSTANPAIQGQLKFNDVALTTSDAPVGLTKLNGTLDITNDHLQVSKLTGQVGGGDVSIGGSIAYRPNLQFNLALQAKSVRLRYPEGLRSLLDANLAFSGNTEASILNGRVLIDNLSFTSDFDLEKFTNQFSTGSTISQPGFADNIQLAIAVQSQQNLNATNSQVSIEGSAALQVGGTAANPVITGRATLSSGELFYRNVRYQLQKGIVTFDNPNETHPVLNVSVATTVEQYNLTLNLRGPLDKLTTAYVSDPPLSTADIINLVARGKTTQESAAQSQSTDSMIASQAASEVTGGLQKLAGISSLEIDPGIGGNGENPSTRVALQQRVTKNLLFTFSTDVSQPGSEIVLGEYQINKRWSVSVERDQVGGVSVDGKYHTKF